jgi:hypothetical protein
MVDADYADMPLLEYDGQPIPVLEWDINNNGRECCDCDSKNVSELLVLWLVTPAHLAYCRMFFCPECRKHAGLEAKTDPSFDVSSFVTQIEDFHQRRLMLQEKRRRIAEIQRAWHERQNTSTPAKKLKKY